MVRTQIYVERKHHDALKREARERGVSMTELVRRIVGAHVERRGGVDAVRKEDLLAFVALGASGTTGGSEHHDEVLAESLRAPRLR